MIRARSDFAREGGPSLAAALRRTNSWILRQGSTATVIDASNADATRILADGRSCYVSAGALLPWTGQLPQSDLERPQLIATQRIVEWTHRVD